MKKILLRRFLYWLSGYLRCYQIKRKDEPYLERYYLGRFFGWTFFLHRFVKEDPIMLYHNHTWGKAYSLILAGWYIEQVVRKGQDYIHTDMRWINWFNRLDGETFHRLEYYSKPDVWTLFVHNKYVRDNYDVIGFRADEYEHYRSGQHTKWWKTAPRGKHSGRQSGNYSTDAIT